MALELWDLVLCSGTLDRHVRFEDRIEAARAGGFRGISLWARDYRAARTAGLSDSDIASMIRDAGLGVAELDLAWWWLPGASEIHIPPSLDTEDLFSFEEADLFVIADATGARSLNAVDVFGGTWDIGEAASAFASLCRRAADHDLLVHIEFLPWSKIPDLETSWAIVDAAGEPNGGVAIDAWHYFRGAQDPRILESIPAERIHCVQLSDAPALPEENLPEASLHDRLLPGEGNLDLKSLVDRLRTAGVECPIGVEVFSDDLHKLAPEVAGRRAGESLRTILST